MVPQKPEIINLRFSLKHGTHFFIINSVGKGCGSDMTIFLRKFTIKILYIASEIALSLVSNYTYK